MHVLDYEPMWHPPTHACSPLLPALLGCAERAAAGRVDSPEDLSSGDEPVVTGEQLLCAFIIGIETQGRLRMGPRETDAHIGQFLAHPPGFVGTRSASVRREFGPSVAFTVTAVFSSSCE